MINLRHEEYSYIENKLPFVLNSDLERTEDTLSREQNWHDDLEIEFCTGGEGTVLINGERFCFRENDIIAINSNDVHYTSTKTRLTYSCIIISCDFLKQLGFDCDRLNFSPVIKSDKIGSLLKELTSVYNSDFFISKTARLNSILIEIIINLVENHSVIRDTVSNKDKTLSIVKTAINFIRQNYQSKISLDMLSAAVLRDKFTLCREFKQISGQTITEYINRYRCQKAAELISSDYSVSQAAMLCGFENLSFFSKTFKKFMGALPSEYK